jgi:hypothetical protein
LTSLIRKLKIKPKNIIRGWRASPKKSKGINYKSKTLWRRSISWRAS